MIVRANIIAKTYFGVFIIIFLRWRFVPLVCVCVWGRLIEAPQLFKAAPRKLPTSPHIVWDKIFVVVFERRR